MEDSNDLENTIPTQIAQLTALKILDLSMWIVLYYQQYVYQLIFLILRHNGFVGRNDFTGTFPSAIGSLPNLTFCKVRELICNQANADFSISKELVLTFDVSKSCRS